MTEPPALPPPALPPPDPPTVTVVEPVVEPSPSPRAPRPVLPWLYAAGFLALAAAMVWLWRHPAASSDVRIDAMRQELSTLQTKVAQLEQRPAASPPVDLRPLTARVTALEQRPADAAPAAPATPVAPTAPAPDLAPLQERLTALEQRPVLNLGPLETRLAALEARQPAEAQLAARVDAFAAREDALGTSLRALQADVTRRLDADETRLAGIEHNAAQLATLADRTSRVARVQAAQAALEAGQPLGEIAGAPAALTRFTTAKPPTLASLRLAFPDAARGALATARPANQDVPLMARMWAAAQDLVTVRHDGRVIIGDPAAAALDRARAALDAGDLAAAVAAVGSLSGPPVQAMAPWLADARAVLDARAALAELAART